jgi:Na+-transporting methylmalonyl-CoA/oxaloacetate decarboxylase beta subunit
MILIFVNHILRISLATKIGVIHTCAIGFSLQDEGDQACVDIIIGIADGVYCPSSNYFCSRVTRGDLVADISISHGLIMRA